MKTCVALLFFLIGCFWVFGSYDIHCRFLAMLGNKKCIPYVFHIAIGVVCLSLSVVIYHFSYFLKLLNNLNVIMNGLQ